MELKDLEIEMLQNMSPLYPTENRLRSYQSRIMKDYMKLQEGPSWGYGNFITLHKSDDLVVIVYPKMDAGSSILTLRLELHALPFGRVAQTCCMDVGLAWDQKTQLLELFFKHIVTEAIDYLKSHIKNN